jgi:plastocyanin
VVRTTRIAQVIAVAAALAVFAAACGDDNGSDTSTAANSGSSSDASAPPVSLQGRVNDHGSSDLGSKTELDLELDDSYFAPTYVTGEPGSTVTVKLENEGKSAHTFTIDGTDVDQQVQPGSSATVEVTLPDEGALAYYCRFHVSGGMQGAFVVSATPASSSGGGSGSGSSTTKGAGGSGGYGY